MTIHDELTEITCYYIISEAARILSARRMHSKEADLFVLGLSYEEEIPIVLTRSNLEPTNKETALAYEKWLCMFEKDRKANLIDCIKWVCGGRDFAAGIDPDTQDTGDRVTFGEVMSFMWPD